MEKLFRWWILAIILLYVSLSFGHGENNGHGMEHRIGLRAKSKSIPLRDDSDYIRETEKVNPETSPDDDYDDGDAYDDEFQSPKQQQQQQFKNKNLRQKNDDEIVEQAQSARTQIIQRPKELTDAEIDALLKPSTTANADTTAPLAIETCPNECSCLDDFMSCRSLQQKHLPKVPQYIQSLELPQNGLKADECEENIKNLSSLIELNLNENKLQRMPIFHGLISLRTLELANNEIREITSIALQALPKLTLLNLSRNSILRIGPNTFPKENLLQKLNLNNNGIEKLDRRAFETLVRLTELKINNNHIGQLPTGLFTKLKRLKKLSLNGNELRKSLQYATFSNLTALTTLKLRNNFIDELITGIFHGLDNLNALDLANNQLTEIQKGGLLNITALTKLNLSNNSIHTIGKNCWEFTQKIIDLDLSQNQLNEINVGTFDMLTKLRVLDLHANQISTISLGAMNATSNLESLDLSQNRISSTIEDSFGPFSSLTKLNSFYLNDNHIKTINKNAFLGLIRLTRLDLRSNNITTIQDGAFDSKSTPAIRDLLMNSTDLICDCKISWFYFWAKNSQAIRKKQARNNENNSFDVRCAYPATVHGKSLLQLQKGNFTCHDTPKPQMIDEPKSTILAIRGTNLTIECTAILTVGTDIVFTWKHNNDDMTNAPIETKTRRKDETRLRVKERVIERRREVNRVPLRINVSAPKVPLVSSSVSKTKYDDSEDDEYESDDLTDEMGESDYDMEEDPYGGDEVDEVIATVEDIEANIPLNSTITTSRLHLTNVDHTHAGRYQCIASNDYGKAYSQRFKVAVGSFPVFTKQPTNVTVKASETVRLNCAVSGDPKPQIHWQFNFGKVFPAARERRMRISDNDETFIIDNAKPSDRGVYTCTGQNAFGIITSNITVDIIEPLTYVKPIEHKDVIIGEYTVLECLNSGSSLSEVRWFRNSKPISAKNSRYLLTKENQLLIIAKTTEEDQGLFTCEMENSFGIEKLLIDLTVHPEPTTVNKVNRDENYTHDEITAIIIITVVVCAIGTSIVWIVIIYHTKKETGCNNNGMDDDDDENGNDAENGLTKEHNVLGTVQISMIPKGEIIANRSLQSMRTATIGRNHGVLRSNSGSSCDHSSIGVSDDIFRRYKDETLRQQNRHGTDSDEDDGNDHEALLGTAYYDQYQNLVKCSDNDSFVVRMHDCVDGMSSQHDTSLGNTTTAECGDLDNDDGQHSSIKTKTSTSLSSSCHSIPPLPLNSSHEFDLNRSHCAYDSPSSQSAAKSCYSNSKSVLNKPVIQPVPIGKTKPTIQTNKLNELMSTFK